MEKLPATVMLSLLDVAEPVEVMSWGLLLITLVIVFVFAVIFTGGLVFLLIWYKRRKQEST